ncbi:primase-helicase family protein [Bifidobacterium olomucense]|uniref:Uncharacterized protein n=1 Tax=Bifidobacterium olomucense TaxID=2675324 RepID=A0A7Y0HX36_9BIFI|nr:primase-helicase family protein [Bifidobacterium sp. DSM 109959]NMM97549.1 hypothetical protein [Bifidobacterium sp. DSM 109959]
MGMSVKTVIEDGVEVRYIDGITDELIDSLVPRWMMTWPWRRARNLMRGLKIARTLNEEGTWGAIKDEEGNTWQLLPSKGVREGWSPTVMDINGNRPRPDEYFDPASIIGYLILGLDSILCQEWERNANIKDEKKRNSQYRLYEAPVSSRGPVEIQVEQTASSLHLQPKELQCILMLMRHVDGVKTARDVLRINGTSYEWRRRRMCEVQLREDEVPLFSVNVNTDEDAIRNIMPLVGQQGFDLYTTSMPYSIIATVEHYFLFSDDGGAGKSTLIGAFMSVFNSISATVTNLSSMAQKPGFDQGYAIKALLGTRMAFIDEAGAIDKSVVGILNSVSTGSPQQARWHNGGEDFWCHDSLYIGTNCPDRLDDLDANTRRRITISFKKSETEEWGACATRTDGSLILDETGNEMNKRDYAMSEECVAEMLFHGVKLILKRQEELDPDADILKGLSMDDVATSENAILNRDEELMQLAERLHADEAVRAYMNGESEDGRSYIPVVAKEIIPSMRNRGTFLEEHGIKIRGPKRMFKAEGKQKPVIAIVDRDAFRPVWDLVQDDKATEQVPEPKWSLVPNDYTDNGHAIIPDCVNTLAAGVNDYLGDEYDMHYEGGEDETKDYAVITYDDGNGTTEVSRLAVAIGSADEKTANTDSLIITRDTATVRLADTGKIYTLKKYAHLVKQHHGQPIGQAARRNASQASTTGTTKTRK